MLLAAWPFTPGLVAVYVRALQTTATGGIA